MESNKELNKNSLEKCLWKELAEDPESTTFDDVGYFHPTLSDCKYTCTGYNDTCKGYKVMNQLRAYFRYK